MPDQPSPDVVSSERLSLPLLSPAQLERLGRGDGREVARQLDASLSNEWLADVSRLAGMRAAQARQRPVDAPWLVRPILLREAPHEAVGYINFHGAPNERGTAEVGYTLLEAHRGRGYAIEAVRALFEWATGVHGVRRFRASVAPDNERSLNLIRKLGFVQVGEQWDEEDGLELVFEVEV